MNTQINIFYMIMDFYDQICELMINLTKITKFEKQKQKDQQLRFFT